MLVSMVDFGVNGGKSGVSSALRLDSHYLMHLKCEAMRRGVWFRVLSRLERGLLNLVVRVVDRPRSLRLIMALARIVVKIKRALRSPIERLMEQIGKPLAKRISRIAVGWGNAEAEKWADDRSFIRYLTIIDVNNIPGFRFSDSLPAK